MKRYLVAALACFALAAAVLALAVLGCADRSRSGAVSTGTVVLSPGGTPVEFPPWLAVWPDLMAGALAEVDAAGVPPGWRVVVRLPKFETAASPTGLARGMCDYDARTLHVGFRFAPCEDRPLLPALEHEVGHIFGGPLAGH